MKKAGIMLVAGAVFYVAVAVWQSVINPGIIPEAAAIAILLGGLCLVLAAGNPETVKRGEIAAIWICVLLFAAYGLLSVGGVL